MKKFILIVPAILALGGCLQGGPGALSTCTTASDACGRTALAEMAPTATPLAEVMLGDADTTATSALEVSLPGEINRDGGDSARSLDAADRDVSNNDRGSGNGADGASASNNGSDDSGDEGSSDGDNGSGDSGDEGASGSDSGSNDDSSGNGNSGDDRNQNAIEKGDNRDDKAGNADDARS